MYLAKVKKRVVSTIKHPAYEKKKVFVVSPVTPDGKEKDREMVAMDYLDVAIGDIVVCGGAPGVAKEVFNLDMAPIRTLIIARVDKIVRGEDATESD